MGIIGYNRTGITTNVRMIVLIRVRIFIRMYVRLYVIVETRIYVRLRSLPSVHLQNQFMTPPVTQILTSKIIFSVFILPNVCSVAKFPMFFEYMFDYFSFSDIECMFGFYGLHRIRTRPPYIYHLHYLYRSCHLFHLSYLFSIIFIICLANGYYPLFPCPFLFFIHSFSQNHHFDGFYTP